MANDFEIESGRGRKPNQRIKAYLVLQYLLKNSDEENPQSVDDIISFLDLECGISAERRALYKDIKELNIANIMVQEECSFSEAEEMLEENKDLALISYKHLHGFFVNFNKRSITPEEARLLAECVYSAKFIPVGQEGFFVDLICNSLSTAQTDNIHHEVHLVDRISTINKDTIDNIDKIKMSLSKQVKIRFTYLKYTLQSLTKQVERRHGNEYVVSPYAMLINEGNYYILAVEDKSKKLLTYRIDRMRKIKLTADPRDETDESKSLDLQDYTRRVFSMYGGRKERVTLRFVNGLLDTVVDRFGVHDVIYNQEDKTHFSITSTVEISDQFFGWLCGLGKKVMIMSPDSVVQEFENHIEKIQKLYQS